MELGRENENGPEKLVIKKHRKEKKVANVFSVKKLTVCNLMDTIKWLLLE